MKIKNNTTGKETEIPKADFDKFSPDTKRKFTVLSTVDEKKEEQVVVSKSPESGTKKPK